MSSKPVIRPITRTDVDAVAALLHGRHMANLSAERVRAIVLHDWPVDRPNYGYLLEAEGRAVGCILAAYSERQIRGRAERFCNIGTWYVEPQFRNYSLPLSWKFRELWGRYTMTALTANETSRAGFERARYQTLAEGYDLYLPGQRAANTRLTGARVLGGADAVAPELDPADRRILDDHRPYGLGHFLLTARGEPGYAYVVTRRTRIWRRELVPASEILYVSNRELARRYFERLMLGVLWGERSLVLASERRFLGEDPPAGRRTVPRLRFFRSETLGAADVDNLYSEAVLL